MVSPGMQVSWPSAKASPTSTSPRLPGASQRPVRRNSRFSSGGAKSGSDRTMPLAGSSSAGQVQGDLHRDAGLDGGHAGDFLDARGERVRRALQVGEHLGEPVGFVVFAAGGFEGEDQAARHDHHGQAAGHHQRHRDGLAFHPVQVAQQLAIEVAEHYQFRVLAGARVLIHPQMMHVAIGQMDHPVGHVGHDGVVGDDDGERAQLAVHALDGLQHHDARPHVQRAGRFVAEQHLGALGDGARDGHALLFAAGELGGEMVQPRAQIHHVQRRPPAASGRARSR